jgi:CspA family cold shock protein
MSSNDHRTGKIKTIVGSKGFGFIQEDSGAKTEFFFHRSGVADDLDFTQLTEGQPVDFDVVPSPKGPRAENVRLA